MYKKLITYTLLFSFLLTVAGCYTTKYYNDTPAVLISKEQGQKGIVYEDLDSLTMINNKTIDLIYTLHGLSKQDRQQLQFVYYYPRVVFDTAKMQSLKSNKALYKDAVPDTLDIRNISMIHYSISELDNAKTLSTIGLKILIPVLIIGLIFIVAIPNVLPYVLGGGH